MSLFRLQNFDLCAACYENVSHLHPMEKHSPEANSEESDDKPSESQSQEKPVEV